MKRSQFCKTVITPGIVCGCAFGMNPGGAIGSVLTAEKDAGRPAPGETPCNEKMDFTQKWVKRFFDILDNQIDEPARIKLMQTNGAACAMGAYGELTDKKPATLPEIDETIGMFQEKIGRENIYRDGNLVYFNYVGSPEGVKISDGFCLCSMIENGPAFL